MNKKIFLISILAVFMLVTISFASAINSNTTNVEKKESPLYRIRTRLAIGEKIGQIFKNIFLFIFYPLFILINIWMEVYKYFVTF